MKRWCLLIGGIVLVILIVYFSYPRSFKEYEFSYTVENLSQFKLVFAFDSDGNYKIEKCNFYMDNARGKIRPVMKSGKFTDEEFERFDKLLKNADIFDMEDMYGYDEASKDEDGFFSQIALSADGKQKYVTIRNITEQKFPQPFLDFIKEVMLFMK